MPGQEPFRHKTRVRFIDTDASGRIHYTAMFRYFEEAEIELLRSVGLTHDPRREYEFPRVHAECDYMFPVFYDDLIEIRVAGVRIGNRSVRIEFETFREGIPAARGIVVSTCVDRASGRSAPIPEHIRSRLALLE